MKVVKSICSKIGILFLLVIVSGMYIMAATVVSILFGVPMGWISTAVIAGALLWEAGERFIPWVRLKWRSKRR